MNKGAELASLSGSISLAEAVLRGLFLLNGGAAIAVLTFLSSAELLSDMALGLVFSLRLFIVGLVLSLLTAITAYFTQLTITHRIGWENSEHIHAGNRDYHLQKNEVSEAKNEERLRLKANDTAAKLYRKENVGICASLFLAIASLAGFSWGAITGAEALIS
ncbi:MULTISPECIES: hypothetical protein [Kordiimonas]|jgi:hypothetical protein|uniref:hypothetical protein n=1 Tax=Kordiimonas TaxID=288021 RepID=UPI00257F9A8B|nr:hypothetical protein [Kordiimonas sp. UBA4487]